MLRLGAWVPQCVTCRMGAPHLTALRMPARQPACQLRQPGLAFLSTPSLVTTPRKDVTIGTAQLRVETSSPVRSEQVRAARHVRAAGACGMAGACCMAGACGRCVRQMCAAWQVRAAGARCMAGACGRAAPPTIERSCITCR